MKTNTFIMCNMSSYTLVTFVINEIRNALSINVFERETSFESPSRYYLKRCGNLEFTRLPLFLISTNLEKLTYFCLHLIIQ